MHALALLALVTLGTEPGWEAIGMVDGVWLEQRRVEGSGFVELKATTFTSAAPHLVCVTAFGTGALDPEEPDITFKEVLSSSELERVTYEQIRPPFVAQRDYVLRARRRLFPNGDCRNEFGLAADVARPTPPGWVRLKALTGSVHAERWPDGRTRVTHQVHSDPGGAVPAFLAEGPRRTVAARWVRNIVRRAEQRSAVVDAGPR